MKPDSSYLQIFRSMSIIGGASLITIVVGLFRTKVVALLLGPAGIGLIGLFQSLMTTASVISSFGFGTVGTRQIVEATEKSDDSAIIVTRQTLFWGTLILAFIGSLIFWLLRGILATQVLNDPSMADDVGWLAIGVALTVVTGSQSATLNGLRRIGDLAKINIATAVISTGLGILVLFFLGNRGVLIFVIIMPMASFLLGQWFISRIGRPIGKMLPLSILTVEFGSMVRVGTAFMISGVIFTLGHLLVRALVQRDLGPISLGQFQASMTISITYIGFILNSMTTDYYPRLTSVIHDHDAASRIVNEQTEVALLLIGPFFLAMMGLAPWVVHLFYSSSFDEVAPILRWQVLGNIFKVVSWPLGIVLLSLGDGRTVIFTETLAISIFAASIWFGLPLIGVQSTGVGFLVMYLVYLPVVYWLGRRRIQFKWEPHVFKQFVSLLFLTTLVFLSAYWSELLSCVLGLSAGVLLAFYGIIRLREMLNLSAPVGKILNMCHRLMIKIGI
jgi:PST family polysaccharide transporter